jgi:hypothetical protein
MTGWKAMLLTIRSGGMNNVFKAIGNTDSCELRLGKLPQTRFIVFGKASSTST